MQGSNLLTSFAFEDALVRVRTDESGNPWFVAKDVCRVLELGNPSEAVRNLEEDEKSSIRITEGTSPSGGNPNMLTISESGLYALIFRSRKPQARRFRKWVTAEVLPAIHKTGRYQTEGPSPLSLPRLAPEALPEDVLRLKPRLRENCLGLAMQAARIAGISDIETVHAWFIDYCRVVAGAPARGDAGSVSPVRAFVETQLSPSPGNRLYFKTIYRSFQQWWKERHALPVPSARELSRELMLRYPSRKSSTICYLDVAFCGKDHT